MDYTEVRFYNSPELNEIVIAVIAEAGFDMFEERTDGVNGYVPAGRFDELTIRDILESNPLLRNIRFESTLIKDRNWNKEWEKNFEPVLIDDTVYIRAPFHVSENYPFEIIIEPKMSFGTGHHATTALMVRLMRKFDLKNKNVLDMGCGSGVLAILAEKMGASKIFAVDFDNWAYVNTIENIERNNCHRITVKEGTAKAIAGKTFDVILANINRNVLLSDMDKYNVSLVEGGLLLLSGILKEDENIIRERAMMLDLKHQLTEGYDNWIAMLFTK